eukprot:2113614-Alexandrium_andersonii.AAC.1
MIATCSAVSGVSGSCRLPDPPIPAALLVRASAPWTPRSWRIRRAGGANFGAFGGGRPCWES